MLNILSKPARGDLTMDKNHTTKKGRSTAAALETQNCSPAFKWAAKVDDQIVFTSGPEVSVQALRHQANVPEDHVLVRDHASSNDVRLEDDSIVALPEGNVFRSVPRCDYSGGTSCDSPAKLAWFVDDDWQETTRGDQTEVTIRDLFKLDSRIQLLRDTKSSDDLPIEEGAELLFAVGPVFVTCFVVEDYCGCEQQGPIAKKYRIKIQGKRYTVDVSSMTGREILILAGLDPEENMLNQRINGRFEPVDLDECVDFTKPGVERFTTLPNEQTEGEPSARRGFSLPERDEKELEESGLDWETVTGPRGKWLLIHDISIPDGLIQQRTSVAILVSSGYPASALDMAYFYPSIKRPDSKPIPQTQATASIDGKQWQRWSRHYTSKNPWKPGEYNVMTHYLLALGWLRREARKLKVAA